MSTYLLGNQPHQVHLSPEDSHNRLPSLIVGRSSEDLYALHKIP